MGNGLSLAVAVGVPLAGGIIEGLLTKKEILGWYPKLKKPTWNPPAWVFGPVWTVLYMSMGAASWIVFKQGGKRVGVPLALYGIQLAANLAWQPLFFKAKRLDLALADSAVMVGMAAAATVSMSQSAGAKKIVPLMVPYLCWISFATALNYKVLELNPEADKIPVDALPEKVKSSVQDAMEKVKVSAAAAAEKVQETAAAATEKVQDTAAAATEKVQEASEAAADKAEEIKEEVAEQVSEATEKASAAVDAAVTPSS